MESDPAPASRRGSATSEIAPRPSLFETVDWAATPLGSVETWPPALRIAAGIAFGSSLPTMIAWGPDQLVVHNESYGELLGRGPGQGRPVRELWADDWSSVEPNVASVLSGNTVHLEATPRTVRRGGRPETAFVTATYVPLRDESGMVAGIFGVVSAVGQDERTEARLRETEERFRLIADSAPVLMWVTQLDRRRSFVNRAYVDFLGITYEEAVAFDWRHVLHPDDHDRIIAESLAGEASLAPFVLEARYRRRDGEWRWMRSISQPRWGPGGEHVGFIGVAHDVTEPREASAALRELNETLERRVADRTADLEAALARLRDEVAERERAEEALRQAQKMEAVGRLTGGIAHDFNNLLTPVIGGLDIIARKVDDPRLKRLAENALESGRRGAKLTTQLLAFSRIQRLQIGAVAVDRVIGNLRDILRHTIGPDVAIGIDLDPEVGLASCDENQLENAILNLAINARDAMPDGGRLGLATARVTEPAGPDLAGGDYVMISVSDSGVGMSEEVAARAAEPFFSTKPLGKGTGLGLAQVYGIARQSGGTMRIESRDGEGTTVRILLPVAEPDSIGAAGEAGRRPSPAAAPGPACRVVVIDDDPQVRAFLAELLDSLGHSAEAHEAPEAALAAIDARPPDLVLIDYAMPTMNGAELACALRRRHPDLPLAFVTGFAESEQLEGALGDDVPVLRKPFATDELSALVARLVGSRRAASAGS